MLAFLLVVDLGHPLSLTVPDDLPSDAEATSSDDESAADEAEAEDAAPVEAEVPRRIGRPRHEGPPRNAVLFDGSRVTVIVALSDLFALALKNRWTKVAQKQLFDVLREWLPNSHQLPSFYVAERMMEAYRSTQLQEYGACQHDHEIMQNPLQERDINSGSASTLEELRERRAALNYKCRLCQTPLRDGKGRIKKVSYYLHATLYSV